MGVNIPEGVRCVVIDEVLKKGPRKKLQAKIRVVSAV